MAYIIQNVKRPPPNFNDATCVILLGMDAPGPAPLHFTYSLRPTLCQAPTPANGDQMTTILSESKPSPQIIYVYIL